MAQRKQTILRRDAAGNVVYDDLGRPLVDRVVGARRSNFARPKRPKHGPVVSRTMTDEERRRYGC